MRPAFASRRGRPARRPICTSPFTTRFSYVFQKRYAGGQVSQMELAQSQSEYETSLATIAQLDLQIAQQEDALSILLGHNKQRQGSRARCKFHIFMISKP